MKIERVRSFTPVVITLETEEEYKVVRACLADGDCDTFKGMDMQNPIQMAYELYLKLYNI